LVVQGCTIISTRLGRISHMYFTHACYELYQTSQIPFLIHWTEFSVCWVLVAPQDIKHIESKNKCAVNLANALYKKIPHKSLLSRFTNLAECTASRFTGVVTWCSRSSDGADCRSRSFARAQRVRESSMIDISMSLNHGRTGICRRSWSAFCACVSHSVILEIMQAISWGVERNFCRKLWSSLCLPISNRSRKPATFKHFQQKCH